MRSRQGNAKTSDHEKELSRIFAESSERSSYRAKHENAGGEDRAALPR